MAATVRTSCPGSSSAIGRGNDSSSRTRTGRQEVLGGDFERGDCLFAPHGGKVGKKLIQRVSRGQVIDKILHRHPRRTEDWRAAHDRWVGVNDGSQRLD